MPSRPRQRAKSSRVLSSASHAHLSIPEFTRLVEGASDYLVTPRIIESDRINHVAVSVERSQLLPSRRVPQLTVAVAVAKRFMEG